MVIILQDLRLGLRSLAKSPGFAAVAMLTLALGIGANVAMYSIVYGVLQRPLPYRDPASLVLVSAQQDFAGERRASTFSAQEISEWEQARTLRSLAGYGATDLLALESADGTSPLEGTFVSESFFSTIGQPPARGRLLGKGDDLSPVAVISERLARRQFSGGSAEAVGATLTLSGQVYTVVGVAAPTFRFPNDRVDVWIPMGQAGQAGLAPRLNLPRGGGVSFIARLKPDATLGQARSELEGRGRRLASERSARGGGNIPLVTPLLDRIAGGIRPALRMLSVAVGLVLLVAAANLANLLLTRHAARERDLAVRRALGASGGRLIAHALAESAILGVGGCLGGVLLAQSIVRTLVWLEPASLPRLDSIEVDAPVLAFAVAIAALATLAASLGPAVKASRQDAAVALGASARIAGNARAGRLRSALVVGELALSVVLLVGSTVLARSLVRLLHTDIGARSDHVLVARLDLSLGRRLSEAQERGLGAALVERVAQLPGVRSAALGSALPPSGRMIEVTLKDLPTARGVRPEYAINAAPTTADFFATLGIPLLKGRLFDSGDDLAHKRVMILSADAAQDLFGGEPLGRTLTLPTPSHGSVTATVVGVVGNVKYKGLAQGAEPTLYVPFAQQPWPTAFLVARTTGEPGALAAGLRRAIGEVDRESGVVSVRTLDDVLARETAEPGFRTAVLSAIAGLALLLAAIGLSGVVGFTVSRRTAEIGVRMALGAARPDVMWMVLREGLTLGAVGGAIGVGAAAALSRFLGRFLFGVRPTDPLSFLGAVVSLILLVLVASYVPARRACRIDPTWALRAE
jgi:putative ABC transport system permease protein